MQQKDTEAVEQTDTLYRTQSWNAVKTYTNAHDPSVVGRGAVANFTWTAALKAMNIKRFWETSHQCVECENRCLSRSLCLGSLFQPQVARPPCAAHHLFLVSSASSAHWGEEIRLMFAQLVRFLSRRTVYTSCSTSLATSF